MNGSIPIGRVVGVPLRMHWSVPLLVVLFGYGLGRQTLPVWTPGRSLAVYTTAAAVGALLLLGSLLLHEAAHAATALRKDISVQDVTLWALGGMTRMGRPRSAAVAFAVAVSGPLTSLVIGGAALGAGLGLSRLSGWAAVPAAVLVWLGWTNLFLAVFNLLPAAPLDGGRVLQALLWWRTGDRERAERAAARSGQAVGMLLAAAGWFAFLRGKPDGLWLVFVGLFMAVVAAAERRTAEVRTALEGVRARDAMSGPVATGPDWLDLPRFIGEVAAESRHSLVPLLDFDGRPSGVLDVRRLASVPAAQREGLRARDVAVPLERCVVAAPGDPLAEVLEGLRPGRSLPVLVVDADRLVGIVTASDIARLVRRHALGGGGGPPGAGQ
jgi:Zn-dependent protease/CBS domain-containing protein